MRPDVGGLLPVFVLDRYEGYEVKLVQDCTRAELDAWVERNAAALREHLPADLVFANHVLLGGPVGAASGARFAVKAHGSELEYSMRGNEALSAWGREALAQAEAVFVGSAHIREVLRGRGRPRRPRPRGAARASTSTTGARVRARRRWPVCSRRRGRIRRTPATRTSGCRTRATPSAWPPSSQGDEPTVVYFGKLLYNKGVHVLLEALQQVDARAVIVGFGDYRETLEAAAGPRTLFTGPLEHRHLVHLLALADATVVPSIFPEAFGMVAAEAAAAGSPPLVARHSGLAEIADGLEQEYPPHLRHLASFATGDAAELAAKLSELLALPEPDRAAVREAARNATVNRWSWAGVARRLLEPFNYPPADG